MSQAAMAIALVAGAVAELWNPPPYRRWPWLTLGAALLICLAYAGQSLRPDLLPVLPRDHAAAPVAALVLPGRSPLYDLVWLLVLGTMGERRFPRLAWAAITLLGGLAAGLLALAWQQEGVGSSLACFALAGALCSDWRDGRGRLWRAGAGLAGTCAAAVLLMERDVHGLAFLSGLAIGFALALRAAIACKAEFRDNVVPITRTDTYH